MKNKVNLWGTHGATILGISLVLFMLSLLITIEYHAYRITHDAQERITVDVTLDRPFEQCKPCNGNGYIENPDRYQCDNCNGFGKVPVSDSVWDKLALDDSAIVAKLPNVKLVEYISRDEALSNFIGGLDKKTQDEMMLLDSQTGKIENPMTPHLMVNFNAEIIPDPSSSNYQDFCEQVKDKCHCEVIPVFAELPNKKGMMDQLSMIFYKVTLFLIFFVSLLLIITVVLINSLIRIAIYSRRDTIATMRLVGAKSSFIGRPFRLRSIAYGAIGGAIASILNLIAIWAFSNGFHLNILGSEHMCWYALISVIVILVGILISYLSTAITIRIHIAKN